MNPNTLTTIETRLEIKRLEAIKREVIASKGPDYPKDIAVMLLADRIKKHRHILEGRNV